MGGRDGEDFPTHCEGVARIPLSEAVHERGDPLAVRRYVAADLRVLLRCLAESARLHLEGVVLALDQQHRFGRVLIERRVQFLEELGGHGVGQRAFGVKLVDMGLDANVGGGFDPKVSPPFIHVEIARQRALNVTGRVMRPSIRLL